MNTKALVAAFSISIAALASVQALAGDSDKYVMINGQVVKYEPGKTIVVRSADNRETVYTLSPSVAVPADVKVGRDVTLYTEASTDGSTQLVSRVVTTSVTPEGNVKRTTEDTRTLPSGATTRTTTTTISGRVEAYEAGKLITITSADGSKATYMINAQSKLPAGLVVGKTVTIVPSDGQTVGSVTYIVEPQN
jgi:uncharacterized protein YndB with AHSA1/START domain